MAQSDRDDNNFDFLRVAAAFAVLVSHQYALSGRPEPVFFVGSWGGIGVLVFFAISGYLVAASWHHDPSGPRFFARRLLRIWPGLAMACLLTTLVLGPLFSNAGMRAYFTSPAPLDYLTQLGLWEFKSQLPGIFARNPIPGSANGSLWTLPIEVRCYVALGLLGFVGLLRRTPWLLAVYVAAAAWFFFVLAIGYDNPLRMKLQMAVVFFAAACLYQVRQHWLERKPWVGAMAVLLVLGLWEVGLQELAFTLGLPLTIVFFGTSSIPVVRRFGRFGDFSYGLYIYAYPVQQMLVALTGNRLSVGIGIVVATLATLTLAAVSWYLIEKPALRLEKRLKADRPV